MEFSSHISAALFCDPGFLASDWDQKLKDHLITNILIFITPLWQCCDALVCSVAKRQRQSFRSALITHTKLAFISILVLLICMLHTWLLCRCYSPSIACSCVDDSGVWVALPAFRGTQRILTHWFILRIIEAVCLMLLHCSTSFLSHLVTDVSTVCLPCSRNVRISFQQRWFAWSFLFSERLFPLAALK